MPWELNDGHAAVIIANNANKISKDAVEKSEEAKELAKSSEEAALEAKKIAQDANDKSNATTTTVNNIIDNVDNLNTEIVNGRQRLNGTTMPTIGDNIRLNEKNIENISDQLKETERETQTLQNGINIVNGKTSSPVDVEVQGRTLVNLIYGTSPFSITLDNTKRYLLITDNASAVTVDGVSQNTPYKFTGKSTTTLTWTAENAALYEVQQADYNKIMVDWDINNVINRYPYVKGVQHLTNPTISADGVNLLPPFTAWELHANSTIISSYELELKPTSNSQKSTIEVNVLPMQPYFIGFTTEGVVVEIYCIDSSGAKTLINSSTNSMTLVTLPTTKKISVEVFGNVSNEKKILKNPILALGSTEKPFLPSNKSEILTNVKLGAIGTSKDLLYKQDGKWLVMKVILNDIPLGDSISWVYLSAGLGFKRFYTQVLNPIPKNESSNAILINEFGESTDYYTSRVSANTTIGTFLISSSGRLNVAVANNKTGFLETYNPTVTEMKAYFRGWKVKTSDATGKPTAWVSVIDDSEPPTQTLGYVSANEVPNYTPYKLSYGLATPQIIDVNDKVQGDIVINGLTQVEVKNTTPGTPNATDIKLTYAGNIRSSLDNVIVKQSDIATELSVHEKSIVDLYIRLKALEDK